jgi:amino acid adenylation domain-containing protein
VNKIKDFSKENKVLLSSILYGSWGVLLQKFNNSNEVLFGTTVSGRPENISSIDKMVGLFINTIPLRVKSEDKTTFIELINYIDKSLNERKGFENTSLIDIKEYCRLKVNEEIFNSIVTIENYPLYSNANKENVLTVKDFSIIEQTNYNMAVEILTFDGIEFKFNFNSLSVDEDIVKKLGVYLERIIDTLLSNPYINLEEVDFLAEAEKHKLLYEFNDTYADYPRKKTIHELFEEQVERTPDNIAVVFEDKKLTYRELNERANRLARTLREKGVKPDNIVGIMVERSLEMIVGIMGILKSGGAYLPIDPGYPEDRIKYMLEDSETKLLLTEEHLLNKVDFEGELLNLQDENVYSNNGDNLEKSKTPKDLAYVIYTSGSTGMPKGVMIEHYSVINRLTWMQKRYPINFDDVILQKTTYTFDVSVWELLWWSLVGAKVCLLPQGGEKDVEIITNYVELNKITVVHFVPSMLNIFLDYVEKEEKAERIKTLKQVFSSGEALSSNQVKRFNDILYKEYKIKLCNLYGPTEATVDVSSFDCSSLDNLDIVPIGKPIDNIGLYVLDKRMNIQPIKIAGELYISGDRLARGYWNNPELTAEKFVDNPFVVGKKMYRTGDLARWLPDGNIEFLWRIDHQIKIRGFRIELGEIESNILAYEGVKETIVVDREDETDNKYLCAYIVSENELKVGEVRAYLLKQLPEYMIPSYFVQLDKIPLTSNGKVDKKVLPEPDGSIVAETEYEGTQNEVQEKLVVIWKDILKVERIGINDNFFELGGHSLKATMLIGKIYKEFNIEVPLNIIFKLPNIKDLSKCILNKETFTAYKDYSESSVVIKLNKSNTKNIFLFHLYLDMELDIMSL